VKAVVKKEE
jgi:hypothetical protein